MNKQIEEMSEFLWDVQSQEDEIEIYNTEALAKRLVDANYRKSTDVAREIFEEIDKGLSEDEQDFERLDKLYQDEVHDYARIYVDDLRERFAELKKKYESEGAE